MSSFFSTSGLGQRPMFGHAASPAFGTSQAGTSLFGAPLASSQSTPFGSNLFGTTSSATAQPGGLFGAPASSSAGIGTSLFGQPARTTSSLFGSGAVPNFSFTNPATSTTSNLFAPATTQSIFSGFNTAMSTAPPQLAGAASGVPTDQLAALTTSLFHPRLFGNELDDLLATFNQLQAYAGFGKGYATPGSQPVVYTPENPFCRFKTVGYSQHTGHTNADGCVGLALRKPADEVEANRQLLLEFFFKLFGCKPNVSTEIKTIRGLPENRCEVVIAVTETDASGNRRRIPATELAGFLLGPTIKPQVESQLGTEAVNIKVDLSPSDLQNYLSSPPPGLDTLLWTQAVKSNPDPSIFIPVQIAGFDQLGKRHALQLEQAAWQKTAVEDISQRVCPEIEIKISTTRTRFAQLRIRHNQLAHRLLKVLALHLQASRQGYALEPAEEAIQGRLEAIMASLNAPMHCQGRLTELLTTIRCQPDLFLTNHQSGSKPKGQQSLDPDTLDELKTFLGRFQERLERLVSLVHQTEKDYERADEISSDLGYSIVKSPPIS